MNFPFAVLLKEHLSWDTLYEVDTYLSSYRFIESKTLVLNGIHINVINHYYEIFFYINQVSVYDFHGLDD